MEERIAKFLAELTALSNKYELQVGGCGCCGSPWIGEISLGKLVEDGYGYAVDPDIYEGSFQELEWVDLRARQQEIEEQERLEKKQADAFIAKQEETLRRIKGE